MTQHRNLCRARDLLAEAPAPTIADAAREAAMSPYHFIRRFEALFGLTPRQYRIATQIDRAKHLLAHGDLSVTEVCLEVGFTSLGSFSDLFARRTGEPPSVYRRRARITVPEILFPGCLTLMAHLPASALRNFQEAPAPAGR
jgi:AraC-like DNA-binding protein